MHPVFLGWPGIRPSKMYIRPSKMYIRPSKMEVIKVLHNPEEYFLIYLGTSVIDGVQGWGAHRVTF